MKDDVATIAAWAHDSPNPEVREEYDHFRRGIAVTERLNAQHHVRKNRQVIVESMRSELIPMVIRDYNAAFDCHISLTTSEREQAARAIIRRMESEGLS